MPPGGGGKGGSLRMFPASVLFSASEVKGDSGEDEARCSGIFGLIGLVFSSPPEEGLLCCLNTGVLFFRLFLLLPGSSPPPPFWDDVVIFTSTSDIFSRDLSSSREKSILDYCKLNMTI